MLVELRIAGFEAIDLAESEFTNDPPPGWELYNPDGLVPDRPTDSDSATGTFNADALAFPEEAPEGENTGYVFIVEEPGTGVAGLSQTTSTVLAPNTQYTLQVAVGNGAGTETGEGSDEFDLTGFPGYLVELLAGEQAIAADYNTVTIAEGTFATSTVTFTTGEKNPLLGENLSVRLINRGSGPGIAVDFDDVQLNAEPVEDDRPNIFIENAGFEAIIVGDGAALNDPPPGWELYDPDGLVPEEITSSNSEAGTFNADTIAYATEAPEGENVGYTFILEEPGSGVLGLSQTLGAVLEPNTEYNLQVQVGNAGNTVPGDEVVFDLAGFPGYRVELLAGEEVLAVDGNSLTIEEGTFATSTVTFTATADNPLLGENLSIRLINLLEDSGIAVDFDDVQLTAAPVMPPGNQIEGTPGPDRLRGTRRDDAIFGQSGDDRIFGGPGNDILNGGPGNDILFGGPGNDTLIGGMGRDILIGGSESDTFVLDANAAVTSLRMADRIVAFQVNLVDPFSPIDRIGLAGGLTPAHLSLDLNNGNTIISIAETEQILGIVADVAPDRLMGRFFGV